MILIKKIYAFILYVSDSGLQCNTIVTDMECNIRVDRLHLIVVRASGNDIARAGWSVPRPLGNLYILILPSISVTII